MPGAVCLQGGAELGAACRAMDGAVLARAGRGPVVVAPLASAPGPEALRTARTGEAHYRRLGADDVRTVLPPETDEDVAAAARTLAAARLAVLPGGSPARLLTALSASSREPLRAALRTVLDDDGVVSGASAGAMALAARTVLPDRPGPDGPPVVDGLGVVERALVLPHWDGPPTVGDGDPRHHGLLGALAPDDREDALATLVVLGLPECSGLLVEAAGAGERRARALGELPTTVLRPGAAPAAVLPGEDVVLP